jgi:flagellar biosynthesis/type III secretory pathway chaperone
MTVQAGDVRTHVARLLADEAGLLLGFEKLLKQETLILRGDDTAAIERIGATRHACMAELTRLSGERDNSCQMLSFGTGRDAFEKLLAWCDAGGELNRRWQSNLTQARRCRDLNDRNGALVAVKLNHVQKLLTAIRGGDAEPVYAQQASRFSGFATRELGQA